jgi:hypothetical protein
MMLWRTVGGLLLLVILGLAAFEILSPSITDQQARDAARAVAGAAANRIFDEACPKVAPPGTITPVGGTTTTIPNASAKRVCNTSSSFATISQDARAAAEQQARQQHVRILSFSLDQPTPVVRVTISKQARSIILIHTPWRHYDDVNASAAASPS